ncbi:MAG: WXG100 family type VII secretion target [Clostridiales bacterium]|uniref:WXG100 family type VII secretion target n=1 Tax=Roseburia sp. MSJ-14 TaxID=2841514 RepID=UPI001692376E|nr:WXG100 family type VII secretion target [Roseburia sp. MSJ-14]MBU5472043.1 WXG100 family type VII secretion target [Roseburia sp. MSJ-14]NLK77929.1 WXG100 family type VII secretion target [Clostridiales bacterium]
MSNGQIRMTPDTMRQRAKQYDDEAGNVDEVISKMDSLLKTLQDEWEGAASQSYAARFTELRPNFVKARDLISEIADALRATAQTIETTDSDIASQFKG